MKRLAIAAVALALVVLASGCLWGRVRDVDTGTGLPGVTVDYTDAQGRTGSTTTDANGFYVFDQATGPVPAAGAADFEVSAPGYGSLIETRPIEYDDDPNASLDNPSSFWEVQHFDLVLLRQPGLTAPSSLFAMVLHWDFVDPETGQLRGGCGSDLIWQDNSDNEVGFRIWRRASDSQVWQFVEEVPPDTTDHTDTGACGGYCYRIAAVGTSGVSEYSNEACAAF